MPINLLAQKKYDRKRRGVQASLQRLRTCRGWALLSRDQRELLVDATKECVRDHIETLMPQLERNEKLDYDEIAEAAIRTVFGDNIAMFTLTLPNGRKADESTVEELMEEI
ncbi:hypothetical protein SCUP234_12086 [Seiridium cupressi]